MDAVVSLLDETHYRLVEELWAELEARFGVRGVYVTPYPHFSYHIAQHYDEGALELVLRRWAQGATPFTVRTGGLGIFTGANPILYIPVVRDPALAEFHRRLWQAVDPAGVESAAYYSPAQWLPHITIGFADLQPATLGEIVAWLGARSFNWEIPVDNLALISESGAGQEARRFPFGRPRP